MDETQWKIMNATMSLIRDKGYVATTTKDIANVAQVNECTLFRKFKNKKDIVLSALNQQQWRADVTPSIFADVSWDLKEDLTMFMRNYLNRVTSDFVKLSIGLRAPQIYDETAELIMKIPDAFLKSLQNYFEQMHQKDKIAKMDFAYLAMTILSATFGFTFLKASFGEKLTAVEQEVYIEKSVRTFIQGIESGS